MQEDPIVERGVDGADVIKDRSPSSAIAVEPQRKSRPRRRSSTSVIKNPRDRLGDETRINLQLSCMERKSYDE